MYAIDLHKNELCSIGLGSVSWFFCIGSSLKPSYRHQYQQLKKYYIVEVLVLDEHVHCEESFEPTYHLFISLLY